MIHKNLTNEQISIQHWISNVPSVSHAVNSQNVIMENTDGVTEFISGAVLLGKNTSDPEATGEELFSNPKNLPDAISTILSHCQKKADYHPADPKKEGESEEQYQKRMAEGLSRYITEIDDHCPFISFRGNQHECGEFSSKNYDQLVDSVLGLFDGLSEEDELDITNSIVDMAKSVFNEKKSEKWRSFFSQNDIDNVNPDSPFYDRVSTTLHMKHEEKGIFKPDVANQDYTVTKTSYKVLVSKIQLYAKDLALLDKKDVDDFIRDTKSPSANSVKICFASAA